MSTYYLLSLSLTLWRCMLADHLPARYKSIRKEAKSKGEPRARQSQRKKGRQPLVHR